MTPLALIAYALIGYLIWTKVLRTYIDWWYYRRQGIYSSGFPIPVFGNLISFAFSLKGRDEFSLPMMIQYVMNCFKGTVPGMVANFRGATPYLMISDPEVISDLYFSKAKYLDKYHRTKTWYQRLTGESVLFDKSSEK